MIKRFKDKLIGEEFSLFRCILVIFSPYGVALVLYPVLHLFGNKAELSDLMDTADFTARVFFWLVFVMVVKYHAFKKQA